MSPELFQQIEELYHAALEATAEERAALLAGTDPELRHEIESLLAQHTNGEFLDRPALRNAPELLGDLTVTGLAAGVCLGPYRIESKLGEGGMGQVFRAVDTRLGRAVAIKIAQERFSSLFEREGRAISSLNHAHICTLHDVGPNYIVMELVEGETIAARLKNGRLPLKTAILYASQIAAALAEAHGKGIVHRDLKPGNIMIARSGIKVLDFGLAKSGTDETVTASRMVMGTPGYMAPEQREGKPADARTDIYSFGCLLYEMLTGGRIGSQRKGILSRRLEKIVNRCLEENPERRWQSAAELERELVSVDFSEHPAGSAQKKSHGLLLKVLGSAESRPYRFWTFLHIKVCIRCAVLVYLAWRFRNATTGRWSLILLLLVTACCMIQTVISAALLLWGEMDRQSLHKYAQAAAPWLRALGLANGLFAFVMAALVAEFHTLLALFLTILGVAIAFTAVVLKPAMDQAAIRSGGQ